MILNTVNDLSHFNKGCVATIGNFDGIHKGHQHVFDQVKALAQKYQVPTVVITFEPHPQEYFMPAPGPERVTRCREKLAAIDACGIDHVWLLKFNQSFSLLSAHDFIEEYLVAKLGIKAIVIGDDFRFGHQRKGDFALLQGYGERLNFEVQRMETVLHKGKRISSTWLRQSLVAADFELARELLGRPYTLCGRVSHGDKIGRTLGYPTANIRLRGPRPPLHGVFAGIVEGIGPAAVSVGVRPTVSGRNWLCEAYILDFEGDLYGQELTIEFVHKCRDELKFESLAELKRAIEQDVAEIAAYFDKHGMS